MKRLGVIGGLGPLATAYFYEIITGLQQPLNEQSHMEILIYSKPSIPDRTAYILNRKCPDPSLPIIEAGKILINAGAEFIAIPCVTAHFFYEKIAKSLNIPVINVLEETAAELAAEGVKKAGLLATDGTVKGKFFDRALGKYGIETVRPNRADQEILMDMIYDKLKKGQPISTDKFLSLGEPLYSMGAEKIIIGCTELSLINRQFDLHNMEKLRYTDTLEVLAGAALRESHYD